MGKSSIKLVFIGIVLVLFAYALYPTVKLNYLLTPEQVEKLKIEDQKEYQSLLNRAISLGLDLQGGMHVLMEADVKSLYTMLATNADATLENALKIAEEKVEKDDADFLSVFKEELEKNGKSLADYYGSSKLRAEDEIEDWLSQQVNDAIDRALEVLENRVDEFGVSEPIIHKQGANRIVIELAGITDPQRVRQLIGKTAKLEFKLLKDPEICSLTFNRLGLLYKGIEDTTLQDTTEVLQAEDKAQDETGVTVDEILGTQDTVTAQETEKVETEELFFTNPYDQQVLIVEKNKINKFMHFIEKPEVQKILEETAGNGMLVVSAKPFQSADGTEFYRVYLVNKSAELEGNAVEDAYPQNASPTSGNIGYEVALALNDDGARQFARTTGANVGKRLAIVLDNKVYSAPVIQVKIIGGRATITGMNNLEEAKDLSIVLKAGSLPTPVKIVEERTVGPSLGKDSIEKGTRSALIGLLIVTIFMLFYYKIGGVMADIALVFNIVIVLGVMGFFHATLTLPGIAGIILTIGMAVDANVLIFERIREELDKGKTPRNAIDIGYDKALSAIVDANITTFIAGVVLYSYGTGPIKGFALTLMIGILASMFTAIYVTRAIFEFLFEKGILRRKLPL
ncbi:MAG: protein translocase subunit SecD [Calditrichia bacterium]